MAMLLRAFWLLLAICKLAPAHMPMHVSMDGDGAFTVLVGLDQVPWFSGRVGKIHVNGQWHSQTHGNLCVMGDHLTTGQDRYGSYKARTLTWASCRHGNGNIDPPLLWETSAMNYSHGAVAFRQRFPNTMEGTAFQEVPARFNGLQDTFGIQPQGEFPKLDLSQHNASQLSCLVYKSTFNGPQAQATKVGQGDVLSEGRGSPVAFFNDPHDIVVIASPGDNFKLASTTVEAGQWSLGLSGELLEIPAGTEVATFFVAGSGLKHTMHMWGSFMQNAFDTHRIRQQDVTLNYLGIFTDNGAYCTGHTHPGGSEDRCNETYFLDLANGFDALGLPIQYLMLDDWWYPGYDVFVPCTRDFLPRANLFPDGFRHLRPRYKALMLYMMVFCNDNIWRNATDVQWLSSSVVSLTNSTFVSPTGATSRALYSKLMERGIAQGMTVFEVDFMDYNDLAVPEYRTRVGEVERWFQGVADAAMHASRSIPLQLCTATPSDLLQTLTTPAVTQMRASRDYASSCREEPFSGTWDIGSSAIIMSALSIAPSKDVLFSKRVQTGLPAPATLKCPADQHDVELDVFVAALSTGPVGVGDGVFNGSVLTNDSLLMRTCRSDGLLLQPDSPVASVDAMFHPGRPLGQGHLWVAPSLCMSAVGCFYHFLAVDVNTSYTLSTLDFWPLPVANQTYVHRRWHHPCPDGASASDCGLSPGLNAEARTGPKPSGATYVGAHSFSLIQFFPVSNHGFALLGELGKIVSCSRMRFSSVTYGKHGGLSAEVRGTPGEVVKVSVLHSDGKVHMHEVRISAKGLTSLTVLTNMLI